VLCWLAGKLPVPEVVAWHEDTENAYLLMTAANGHMSCENGDYDAISPPMETTVKLLADGLKLLQTVDISDCPFENRLTQKLEEALYNIEHNLVDMDDFEEGNDFDTPLKLYQWLLAHQPAEELVFAHGDYCLPNVFIDGEHITGFIDVGNAGVADKWQDIALCVRSLGYNLFLDGREREKEKYTALLFDSLGFPPAWEKINYYILLDELF
jgi:kanamycin kinase/aminoglycoside 3'-phosphotransferase-3